MKLTPLFAGAAALAIVATANADVTINVTGATAFRGAALTTIRAAFSGTPDVAWTGTAGLSGADQAIFRGTFPGIAGQTIIRCTWSGSVEGVRDVTQQNNVNFLTTAALVNSGDNPNVPVGTNPATAQFAFSDVFQTSTPYLTPTLSGGPVGVVVFTMLGNEGNPMTNVTSQQYRAILSNGFQPLSLFTGNPAHTTRVFVTGRNDGSGTRTTALAENGFGIANPVQQYKPTIEDATTVSQIRLWPAGDGANASTVWGNDVAGNGGYVSSSGLRSLMGKTTASTQVLAANGTPVFAAAPIHLVTWVGISDAITAISNGAVALAFNGVGITPANPLGGADLQKITEGQYTAWGYEHLFYFGTLSADVTTFYNALVAGMNATNLGISGIPLDVMNVGRTDDGGTVAP